MQSFALHFILFLFLFLYTIIKYQRFCSFLIENISAILLSRHNGCRIPKEQLYNYVMLKLHLCPNTGTCDLNLKRSFFPDFCRRHLSRLRILYYLGIFTILNNNRVSFQCARSTIFPIQD